MTPRQWLVYAGYTGVWEAVARLPDRVARHLAGPLGDLWWRLASARRRTQVRANFARVLDYPPAAVLDRTVRHAFQAYARYWIDAFRAHTLDPDQVVARTVELGLEHLDEVRRDGGGAILATGHLGSWDTGAFFSTRRGWRLTVVAEVLEPRPLFERFVQLRRQLGLGVIPLVRGGDMLNQLEAVVRDGGTATLLADRDLTKKGPIVEFFGEPCRLPPGPAALARRTGRPVVAGAFFSTPSGWRGLARAPVDVSGMDVAAGTQVVARELERVILHAPEQWHVFVPNWLADREPGHSAL